MISLGTKKIIILKLKEWGYLMYEITDTTMFVEYENMEIILFPEVNAETKDKDVYF